MPAGFASLYLEVYYQGRWIYVQPTIGGPCIHVRDGWSGEYARRLQAHVRTNRGLPMDVTDEVKSRRPIDTKYEGYLTEEEMVTLSFDNVLSSLRKNSPYLRRVIYYWHPDYRDNN